MCGVVVYVYIVDGNRCHNFMLCNTSTTQNARVAADKRVKETHEQLQVGMDADVT